MDDQLLQIDEAQVDAEKVTEPAPETSAAGLEELELLEDISIDGMCGVY